MSNYPYVRVTLQRRHANSPVLELGFYHAEVMFLTECTCPWWRRLVKRHLKNHLHYSGIVIVERA